MNDVTETTLGDLIALLSDEMAQSTNQRQEVYNAVAYVLADLFNNRSGRFKARNFETLEAMVEMDNDCSWQ